MTKEIRINSKYYDYLEATKQYQVFYGGSSAGKSYFVFQRAVLNILNSPRNQLIIRKYSNTLYDSCVALVLKIILELGIEDRFVKSSSNSIYFKSEKRIICKNGYQMIFRGLDDPEKIKSITTKKGLIKEVICEEASELEEDDFKQLTLRLRGLELKNDKRIELVEKLKKSKNVEAVQNEIDEIDKKHYTLILNPISETHWIKKRFYDKLSNNTLLVHSTYRDNLKYLAKTDIEAIEYYKTNDPLYYQIYGLGEWGRLNYHDTVFQLSNVQAMFDREIEAIGDIQIGADIARYGDDKTIFYKRKGMKVIGRIEFSHQGTVETARKLIEFADNGQVPIKIDDTGVGGGVTDYVRDKGYNAIPINFGSASPDRDKYNNLISYIWFYVAGIIDQIDCPEYEYLKDDLIARKYRINEKGQRQIESKKDFKKRLGRSADDADAFLLCFYEKSNKASKVVGTYEVEDNVVI